MQSIIYLPIAVPFMQSYQLQYNTMQRLFLRHVCEPRSLASMLHILMMLNNEMAIQFICRSLPISTNTKLHAWRKISVTEKNRQMSTKVAQK